jgi:hypothetical protein
MESGAPPAASAVADGIFGDIAAAVGSAVAIGNAATIGSLAEAWGPDGTTSVVAAGSWGPDDPAAAAVVGTWGPGSTCHTPGEPASECVGDEPSPRQ